MSKQYLTSIETQIKPFTASPLKILATHLEFIKCLLAFYSSSFHKIKMTKTPLNNVHFIR